MTVFSQNSSLIVALQLADGGQFSQLLIWLRIWLLKLQVGSRFGGFTGFVKKTY